MKEGMKVGLAQIITLVQFFDKISLGPKHLHFPFLVMFFMKKTESTNNVLMKISFKRHNIVFLMYELWAHKAEQKQKRALVYHTAVTKHFPLTDLL